MLLMQKVKCSLGIHQPVRHAVKWNDYHFTGRCAHCSALIERVKRGVWRERSSAYPRQEGPRFTPVVHGYRNLTHAFAHFSGPPKRFYRCEPAMKASMMAAVVACLATSAAYARDTDAINGLWEQPQIAEIEMAAATTPPCSIHRIEWASAIDPLKRRSHQDHAPC